MSRPNQACRFLGWGLLTVVLTVPVLAHTVKVSGDVAATFHIEPNHNPIAGQPSLAWVALTRKGGQLIPLIQCNCQLAVYPIPYDPKTAVPLLKPTLKTVNAGQYKGILGATIVFPKAGEYQLKLTGTAKAPATFKPFALSHTVRVTSGKISLMQMPPR